VQQCRIDRLGHVIANDEVRIGCAEITRVSLHSLAERGIRVADLSVNREHRSQGYRAPIERVLTGNFKLFSWRERFVSFRLGQVRLFGMMPKIRPFFNGSG
jgi:hypothetical protein